MERRSRSTARGNPEFRGFSESDLEDDCGGKAMVACSRYDVRMDAWQWLNTWIGYGSVYSIVRQLRQVQNHVGLEKND